jgi:hypothetical protein
MGLKIAGILSNTWAELRLDDAGLDRLVQEVLDR